MADGWEAQGRKQNSIKHHAGYRAGLGLEAGQRDTYFCVLSVYFCSTSIVVNTVIQRRNSIFKIKDFSSHKGQGIHRKQTVKTSMCACYYYTAQTCLLHMKGRSVKQLVLMSVSPQDPKRKAEGNLQQGWFQKCPLHVSVQLKIFHFTWLCIKSSNTPSGSANCT